jgi:hypothetical protein
MSTHIGSHAFKLAGAIAAAFLLGGCASDDDPTAPLPAVSDESLADILLTAIQDEFHAEAVYDGVIEDFGPVAPFSNIVGAEIRHSTAIATLYAARGWAIPTSAWSTGNVPHFGTIGEACAVGADAEVANIDVYDELMEDADLPDDVVRVFASNRLASLERHLPAFQLCAS